MITRRLLDTGVDLTKPEGKSKHFLDLQTTFDDIIKGMNVAVTLVAAPATATSPGVVGNVAFDASYFYVCIATNSWKRTAIAAW